MKFEQIIYEEKDQVAWMTLNRPEKMNALSMRLSDEIVAATELVRQSTDLKFLVIKGAGDNFCVGDDITEMIKWGNANDIMRRARYYQNMANQLEELDKITIAAVGGDELYRIEAAIPWSVFGVTPSVNSHFGFALSVSDNDDTGTNVQQSMASSASTRKLTDPTTWGELVLGN